MKMRARVRAILDIEFDHDVPELEYEPAGRQRPGRETWEATNEPDVATARAGATHRAAQLARAVVPDATEILVEVVEEVTET